VFRRGRVRNAHHCERNSELERWEWQKAERTGWYGPSTKRDRLWFAQRNVVVLPRPIEHSHLIAIASFLPQEPVTTNNSNTRRGFVSGFNPSAEREQVVGARRQHNSRFSRSDIRPMPLSYPISYPSTKTSVVGSAYDEQCAASVRATTSVERMQRDTMLVYTEEERPRSREARTGR
jgi:hypothetical protein